MNERSISPGLGKVVLFGSGETSATGRKVFAEILEDLPEGRKVVLLETPAGFELNSSKVIGRVAEFFEHRLQNFAPQVTVVPARKRGTPWSPDAEEIVAPILEADVIFLGPGSPTYAVRQLKDSLAWHYILARHRLGAILTLASAAAIAFSSLALPVYEIFKVGEEVHWKPGLDFFASYGMPLVFVPHWNNTEGGAELDTRFCFMGAPRFKELFEALPIDQPLIGIDESTALIMDMQTGQAQVRGMGGVTVIHARTPCAFPKGKVEDEDIHHWVEALGRHVHHFSRGEAFSLEVCCPYKLPREGEGLPIEIWRRALQVHLEASALRSVHPSIPEEVMRLVELRQKARLERNWHEADALREQIALLGWQVLDTPAGPEVKRLT